MTYILDEKYSKRILKLGFTVIRDGQIYQYAPIGNDIKKLEVWPELKTLKDSQFVTNMRIKEISWCMWDEYNYNFAGIKLTNNAGKSSEFIGE